MKKLFNLSVSILLCLCTVLGLTACGDDGNGYEQQLTLNDKTAQQVYAETIEAIESYEDNFTTTVEYDIVVAMDFQGETIEMDMTLDTSFKKNGGDIYEKSFVDMGKMSYNGIEMDLGSINKEVYLVNDVAYLHEVTSVLGENSETKRKMNVSLQYLLTYMGKTEDELMNPLYDFTDVSFDNVKFNVGSEDIFFELVLSGEEAQKFTNKLLQDSNVNSTSLTYSEISYKFFVNSEGVFDHAKIDFDVDAVISGMKYKYSYSGIIKFSDIGTTEITAPADAEDYVLIGSVIE